MRRIFYHGTSRANAEKILKEGFKVTGVTHNWDIPSKEGFCYFSTAYAPFYALNCKVDDESDDVLALIKVEIDDRDLYPEDDFVMYVDGKPKYTSEDLSRIDFERSKSLWRASLKYMGNVCAKPSRVRILGVKYFNGVDLINKCDPVITPRNFQFCGKYYEYLTEQIFIGTPMKDITDMNTFIFGADAMKELMEQHKKSLEAHNG